ncbi:MAG TPA: DUF4416 family protein [Pirellulaceae bacterium]|nr:DUF4416 family protein [Pirellulaceae bacterium]
MAHTQPHIAVLRILAAFSRYPKGLDWARRTAEAAWGPVALESERFEHRETNYYDATMGTDLEKCFFAFETLADPAALAEWKLTGNQWEIDYQQLGRHPEPRPLNLDPGYLTDAKLVLATTKDRDHRIYLRDGIFAEVTLHFHRGRWEARPWTYPDYQRADYHAFFLRCRDFLRRR